MTVFFFFFVWDSLVIIDFASCWCCYTVSALSFDSDLICTSQINQTFCCFSVYTLQQGPECGLCYIVCVVFSRRFHSTSEAGLKRRRKKHLSLLPKVGQHLLFADYQTKWGLNAGRVLLSEKRNQESVNIRQRPET